MRSTDILVQSLQLHGVKYIFGVPGEENLMLLESLSNSTIKYVVARDERSAGFMAATVGRLTGSPGVVSTTLGPGATNLITSLAYATNGGYPMLALTAQKPVDTNSHGNFQVVDILSTVSAVTKSAVRMEAYSDVPHLISSSIRISQEPRRGAVLIEIPEDVSEKRVTNAFFKKIEQTQPSDIDRLAISALATKIRNSARPLLIIGGNCRDEDDQVAVREFVDRFRFPFYTSQLGKGVVSDFAKSRVATLLGQKSDTEYADIPASDLVIYLGYDTYEKNPLSGFKVLPREIISLNSHSSVENSHFMPIKQVVGKISTVLDELSTQLIGYAPYPVKKDPEILPDQSNVAIDRSVSTSLSPNELVTLVQGLIGRDTTITLDNGLYKLPFAKFFKSYHHESLLLDNSLATMGAGLPSAVAVKLVRPERQVISVVGDGGLMMSIGEVESAVRLGLDIMIIVVKDNGFGMIKWHQANSGLREFGVDFTATDFVMMANSLGASGHYVELGQDLAPELHRILNLSGVKLVEIPVDYDRLRL